MRTIRALSLAVSLFVLGACSSASSSGGRPEGGAASGGAAGQGAGGSGGSSAAGGSGGSGGSAAGGSGGSVDGGGGDAGASGTDGGGGDGSTLPPSPDTLTTGTWMLYGVARTPDTSGTCYATLVHVEVTATSLVLGERRIECDATVDDASELDFTLSGTTLSLGGQAVGSFDQHTLTATLPAGAGSLQIDLTKPSGQYQDSAPGVGGTVTHTATATKMPDDRPIALAIKAQGSEDTPLDGYVRAARLPTASVTYAVATPPASGTLPSFDAASGQFRYLGNQDFNGADSFVFSVSDGANPATQATASVELAPVNDPPVANGQSVSVVEDTPTPITLDASDVDGDPLTFPIMKPPTHGTLSGAGPVVTYTPDANYNGADSFQYVADDGQATSSQVTVSITVTPVNDAPVASDVVVTTKGTNRAVAALKATDVDSANLAYSITAQPAHGAVTGALPNAIYKATAGYTGDDVFSYTASDGQLTSAPATVTIHVLPNPYTSATISTAVTNIFPLLDTGSRLYFVGASDSAAVHGAVWVTDGTAAGTSTVLSNGSYFQGLLGGQAFSVGGNDVYTPGATLYSLQSGATLATFPDPDSTTYSTVKVGAPSVQATTAYVLLEWTGSTTVAPEIWSTDGTAAGTSLLYQLPAGPAPCTGIVDYNGKQYVGIGGTLMAFQGATQAPAVVTTLAAGSTITWLAAAGPYLFFEQDDAQSGGDSPWRYLVKSDGTAGGTTTVGLIDNAYVNWGAGQPTAYNSKLYYAHQSGLYASDGSAISFISSAAPSWISVANGKLFYTAGSSPWTSDGTSAGTLALSTANMTVPGWTGDIGRAFDGLTFFAVSDSVLGTTLWSTDGTPAGTAMAYDVPALLALGAVNSKLVVWGCPTTFLGGCTNGVLTAVWRP